MKTPRNNKSMRMVLIGYRGCGKTTVARALATLTGKQLVDTDEVIKQHAGKSIAEIFTDEGEHRFRQYERDVIADLVQQPPDILSVGGGAVLDPQNVANLRAIGTIIWLRATVEVLRKRIMQHDATFADRPALRGENSIEEITALLAERSPLYENAATHIIDTTTLSPAVIAKRILELV